MKAPQASLTSTASLLLLAKTVGFVFSIALPLILARSMDQTELGRYKQAFLVVASALQTLPLGFGMNSFFFLSREPQKQASVVGNIVYIYILVGGLAALTLMLYPRAILLLISDPILVAEAPWIGLTLWLWIVASFIETIPLANGQMKFAAVIFVATGILRTGFLLIAATTLGSVHAMIVAGAAYGAVASIALGVYLQTHYPGFLRAFDWTILKKQLSYSIPLGLVGLLYVVQTDLHNYVVSNRFGAAAFAVYSFGTLQLPFTNLIIESVNSVLIPTVGALQQKGDHHEVVALIVRAMRKMAAVFFPIYAFLLVTGKEFIVFLFTAQYRESWPIFAINLTLLPLSILLLDSLFRAYPSERFFLVRIRIVSGVVLALLLWAGTAYFGMIGAVGSVVLVVALERLAITAHFGRLMGVTRKDAGLLRDLGKLAVAAALAGCAAALVHSLILDAPPIVILLGCGIPFLLVYVGAGLFLGIMNDDEKALLRRKLTLVFN